MSNLDKESQIPPPIWRGPSRREHSPAHPTDTPFHIKLPQKVTDSDKLVYISHPARGDSDSGEHSPADSKGADIYPGPAVSKAHRYRSQERPCFKGTLTGKHSGTEDLLDPALKLKITLHIKKVLLVGALTQGNTQQQNPLGILVIV